MKNLARFSLHNRSLITLLAIVSAVFGCIAFSSMRQDLVPAMASPTISIVTSYEAATPTVVDSEVSSVIETIVESVDGLESTTTYSGSGLSLVTATFELGLDTTDVSEQISKKIGENRTLLPDDLKPQVSAASVDDFPVMQFAISPGETQLTKTLQDSISKRVEGVAGVREARFVGVADDQMQVKLDESRSDETGIRISDLQAAILSGGAVDASGSVTEGERTFDVQSGTAVGDAEDIAAIPVVAPKTGETLTVGEVATVQHMVPGASIVSRVDGDPTVVMMVTKVPNANTVELAKNVAAEMADVDAKYDLESTVVFDQSPYIQKSIETLATEGLIGLVCAVIVVLFFLASIRTTLVTAFSIPSSILLAAIAMTAAGFSINMITLAALTVAIGRVVDDSIVVVESIEREMLVTADRFTAITTGVATVASAVMSSTLTTVAVFLPIAYIGGTIGELFRPFALTAAAAMLASLVISLTIIPVLAYWFVHPRPLQPTRPRFDERVRNRIDRGYRPVITWSLARPWRIVAFSLAIVAGTSVIIPGLSTGYLAPLGDTQIRVMQKLDPTTSVASQQKSAEIIEGALAKVDGVERVQTSIRSSGSIIKDASLGGGAGIASYLLSTPPDVDQTAMIDEVRDRLESLPEYDTLGEIDYSIASDMEFSSGIEISVTAIDDAGLTEAIAAVTENVEALSTVADTESTAANTVEHVDIDVDGEKTIEYDLTDQDVRDAVTGALSSAEAGTMVVGGDTLDILVYPEKRITATADLDDIPIDTPMDGEKPLSTFATVTKTAGPVVVQSQQGLRSAVITVEPRTDNLGATSDQLAAAIDDIDLPDGATVSLGGSVTARVDAFQQMGIVSLIAVLIVYTIMVAAFRSLVQPALLLVAIPFAATGGAIIQGISGEPIGIPSLIGCLMLVGIVVTNSIVLVDLVNQRRAAGMPLHEAIIDGASRRIRPILMTAAATVFALVPMALGFTNSSAFISRPLALVVIGGLVSSTLLTLIVLPVLYFLLERWREQRRDRRVESEDDGVPRYKRGATPSAGRLGRPAAAGRAPVRPSPRRAPIERPSRSEPRTRPRVVAPSPTPPERPLHDHGGRTSAPDGSERGGTRTRYVARLRSSTTSSIDRDQPSRQAPRSREADPAHHGVSRVAPTGEPVLHIGPVREDPTPATHPAADLERTTRFVPAVTASAPVPSPSMSAAESSPDPRPVPLITPTPALARPSSAPWGASTGAGAAAPGGGRRTHRGASSQYVTFSQDEERLETATLSTWWTIGSGGRRPLLMIDPFTPHASHGVGVATPVRALEFSGSTLSPDQFSMAARLSQLLRTELHGYSYFAAQLVLWEILGPSVDPDVDVRVPAEDADVVGREFDSLYDRVLSTTTEPEPAMWVVTPTAASEPRMLIAGLD
ncbi:AcrB/AcrD/AcrF family protein [Labedella phragmitis]|uniref:AcrB/AcrD/AcrF family protein n=1 Tax=Labedella phragmitis TaxID=2498849 RepID=A0A3S4DEJ6_9MICO|nr:efflux RND transporter permease subunit [Labedella phragmitis]RWZ50005.1 AcrB/AcrD/AcrF family protein [Labedella phragmitis]